MDDLATTPDFGLLIIGSGPAGVHAAAAYVEAGGRGAVGLVTADLDEPYQRPPLSKAVLAGEEAAEGTPILEDVDLARIAEVRLGTRVEHLDVGLREVTTDSGDRLRYDRLVVATGSDPVRPTPLDPEAAAFTLRSLEHGRRLADAAERATSAVVVGSGFIGCEAAASLAGRGIATTLVTPERAPQEARLGEWAGARLAAWLTAAGVVVRTGVQVEAVEQRAVRLDDGVRLDADLVLLAVGVTQAREFLTASALSTDDDGHLVVDRHLRTSDERVWAAGDVARADHAVARRPLTVEHWGDAIAMGRLAGRNAALDSTAPHDGGETRVEEWADPPGFWSEISGRTLKYSAWGDGYADARVVEHGEGAFTVWYTDSEGRVVGVLTHESDEDYERGQELLAARA